MAESSPIYLISILLLGIGVTEWLVQNTFLRHFGNALSVILLAALMSNLGLIPTAHHLYEAIFTYVAPIAIFLLLLQVNLRNILKAGTPMLAAFTLGAMLESCV